MLPIRTLFIQVILEHTDDELIPKSEGVRTFFLPISYFYFSQKTIDSIQYSMQVFFTPNFKITIANIENAQSEQNKLNIYIMISLYLKINLMKYIQLIQRIFLFNKKKQTKIESFLLFCKLAELKIKIIYQRTMTVVSGNHWENVGKVISALWFVGLFTVIPYLLKLIWPVLITFAVFLESKLGSTAKVWLYVIVANGTNVIVLGALNLAMWRVYIAKSPFLEQFRVSPQSPWPWQQNTQSWSNMLRRTLIVVLFNAVVVNGIMTFGESLLHQLQYTYTLKDWPTLLQMLTQFLIFFSYMEFVSYWAHWAFHLPAVYRFHKRHHEYNTSIALTATYANPIQYIFSNLLSVAVCIPLLSLVVDVHIVSMVPWITFRLIQTVEVHTGYNFPWGVATFLPWKNTSSFHDFHHSHNSGNYGSMFLFMDRLFQTDISYNQYQVRKSKKTM